MMPLLQVLKFHEEQRGTVVVYDPTVLRINFRLRDGTFTITRTTHRLESWSLIGSDDCHRTLGSPINSLSLLHCSCITTVWAQSRKPGRPRTGSTLAQVQVLQFENQVQSWFGWRSRPGKGSPRKVVVRHRPKYPLHPCGFIRIRTVLDNMACVPFNLLPPFPYFTRRLDLLPTRHPLNFEQIGSPKPETYPGD